MDLGSNGLEKMMQNDGLNEAVHFRQKGEQ